MSEEETQTTNETTTEEAKFTQQDVDRILQDRLARERSKYSNFEELQKKVSEYEKMKNEREEKELEAQKEYEKLKEGWTGKENEYKSLLSEKDKIIQEKDINYALSNEVMKQNAYPEAIDLLKTKSVFDDGQVKIKGKDSNGMETLLSIDEGVKSFLQERPYLVKSVGQKGSGTTPAGSGGQGLSLSDENLADELSKARAIGDRKRVQELKMKIRGKHTAMGISASL